MECLYSHYIMFRGHTHTNTTKYIFGGKTWKKVGRKKKVESMRGKGQESHNRRVGNPPNSPLGPPPIESVGLTFDIF